MTLDNIRWADISHGACKTSALCSNETNVNCSVANLKEKCQWNCNSSWYWPDFIKNLFWGKQWTWYRPTQVLHNFSFMGWPRVYNSSCVAFLWKWTQCLNAHWSLRVYTMHREYSKMTTIMLTIITRRRISRYILRGLLIDGVQVKKIWLKQILLK